MVGYLLSKLIFQLFVLIVRSNVHFFLRLIPIKYAAVFFLSLFVQMMIYGWVPIKYSFISIVCTARAL